MPWCGEEAVASDEVRDRRKMADETKKEFHSLTPENVEAVELVKPVKPVKQEPRQAEGGT